MILVLIESKSKLAVEGVTLAMFIDALDSFSKEITSFSFTIFSS